MRLKVFLIRWHRRIGIISVFLVSLITVTGLFLNHASLIKFDQIHLENNFILSLYNQNLPKDYIVNTYALDQSFLVQTQDGFQLYNTGGAFLGTEYIIPENLLHAPLPDAVKLSVEREFRGSGIPLDRVILDVHSGKILGLSGTIIADITALAILFLCGTGLYQFIKRKKK